MTRPMLDFLIRLHKNGEDQSSMVYLIVIDHRIHFDCVFMGAAQSIVDAIKLLICRMMELMMPDIESRMKNILWLM